MKARGAADSHGQGIHRDILIIQSPAHRADEDVVVVVDLGLEVGEGDGEAVRVLDLMRCVEDR